MITPLVLGLSTGFQTKGSDSRIVVRIKERLPFVEKGECTVDVRFRVEWTSVCAVVGGPRPAGRAALGPITAP